jgi:LDH2 family malate/lactate/ureidoglycolate dehydrogenase
MTSTATGPQPDAPQPDSGPDRPLTLGREGDSYRLDAARLESLVAAMLERTGVPAADAAVVAESLVGADVRGMTSHGLIRLPVYIQRLQQGGFNPVTTVQVLRETEAIALLDGGNGLGAVLSLRAMDMAIDKARGRGIAAVGVRNSNHNGEGAYYVQRAVRQDMIGIATTNASPIMPVWGGKTPLTGPLPISVGVPTATGNPIVLDAALGMSSRGKILYHAEKGLKLPDGWLVDADGRPTNDPEWVRKGGWILPIGGHKGWGLILVCEILTGLLTGGAFGAELTNLYDDLDQPQRNAQFVVAIDIASFVDVAAFKQRMDAYIAIMRASELAPDVDEILMPGEIEFRRAAAQRADGVLLSTAVVDEVLTVARGLGLTPDDMGADAT